MMEAARRPLGMRMRRSAIGERFNLPYFDGVLLAAAIGLIAFSVFTLATATRDDIPGQPLYFMLRQSVFAAICLVLVFGAAARGSRRWIELPYFRFQPSELAKVLLVVALAAFVIERTRRGSDARQTIRMLALGLAPAGLVFLQPDLGTGIVLLVITLVVLLLAGLKWSHFAAIGGVAALAVSFV